MRVRQHAKTNARGCRWEVYVSYKSVVRGKGEKTWVLGVTHEVHSHELVPDPLAYPKHKKMFALRDLGKDSEGVGDSVGVGGSGQSKEVRLVQAGGKECEHEVEKQSVGLEGSIML